MRFTITLPIALLAATAAPAMAAPSNVMFNKIWKPTAGSKNELRSDLGDELMARGAAASNIDRLPLSFIQFADRRHPMIAREDVGKREPMDELLARTSWKRTDATGVPVTWKSPLDLAPQGLPPNVFIAKRALEDELLARAEASPSDSEAVNWGGVLHDGISIVSHLLRRELQDELVARAASSPGPSDSEAINWDGVIHDGISLVGHLLRREIEGELVARTNGLWVNEPDAASPYPPWFHRVY